MSAPLATGHLSRLRVFDMGDAECEWWVGACTAEEMRAAYERVHGAQAEFDVRELSAADMEALTFYDETQSPPDARTFREQFTRLDHSDESPRVFAIGA